MPTPLPWLIRLLSVQKQVRNDCEWYNRWRDLTDCKIWGAWVYTFQKKYIKQNLPVSSFITSWGPPGLWLAVRIKAPVAFSPWYGHKNTDCHHYYCSLEAPHKSNNNMTVTLALHTIQTKWSYVRTNAISNDCWNSWCWQQSILSNPYLLHSICRSYFNDNLNQPTKSIKTHIDLIKFRNIREMMRELPE